jgi:hypothetical protein
MYMAKRIKKPPVEPSKGREWLRRYEEEGQSPPQIAKADGYDARTVRRQIEIEREKRERKEARLMVLRQAMEQHYNDLCSFASRLLSEVSNDDGSLWSMKDGYMWSALKEHLPRSPIWKNLEKWEGAQDKIKQLRESVTKSLEDLIQPESLMKSVPVAIQGGKSIQELLSAAIINSSFLARQETGVSEVDFTYSSKDGESTDIELKSHFIARVPNDRVTEFLAEVVNILNRVTAMPEYLQMKDLLKEREKAYKIIQDELTIIIFRRVVPGKCKFCPI